MQLAQVLVSDVLARALGHAQHYCTEICLAFNIHCRKSLIGYYGEQEGGYLWNRLKVHYTPKHGSWLNQAEIELSLYSRQCLGKRRIPDLAKLKQFKYGKPDSSG
jgi:hypothetical protein